MSLIPRYTNRTLATISSMNITQSIVAERDRALLGGDYASYHAQATRKIHNLRRRLGAATPRGRKYTPKAPVTAEQVSKDTQWIQLLLASSERAWADAMTMKSTQSPENTQKPMPGSTKKQIVSRFRRAISHCSNLVDVLSDTSNSSKKTDLLEAKAYLSMLKGGLEFERGHWLACIQHYAVARLIYVALDANTKTDVYKDLLSNTVDPSIKYAAYQSKFPRTKPIGDIAIENFLASEGSSKKEIQQLDSNAFITTTEQAASKQDSTTSDLPATITWRSRKVKLEDAAVSQALGTSSEREKELNTTFVKFSKDEVDVKELAAKYEEVIDARQEAVDITKSAIDELRSQGVDQGDSRIQSLQITRTAVNYAVIEWRIGRNRILCGKDDGVTFEAASPKQNSKPRKDDERHKAKGESSGKKLSRLRERVVLYDAILQSLDAVKDLPGVVADADLVQQVEGKKAYFRALKCLAIGRSQSLHGDVAKALALISRASELAEKAIPASASSESERGPPKLDVTSQQLSTLRQHSSALALQYRALTELGNLNVPPKSTESGSKRPFIERFYLNQYDSELDPKNLVNYPPKIQPVPVKPLFFDLAWNYIRYPGQEQASAPIPEEKESEVKQEEKPAKRGWFGFGR